MLRSINELYNYVLAADDGEIGRCKDFLFDDLSWTIRYMEADTGKWLSRRKVLISPISLGEPEWHSSRFPVWLSKKQIKESPGLEENAPVSRQQEILWSQYYGWPYYWGAATVETTATNANKQSIQKDKSKFEEKVESFDRHLRSIKEVTGYHIHARDGEIGHVEDFILDDGNWVIRYMVVDTRNWLPGRKVLVNPSWIQSVDWFQERITVDLTKEQVESSPEYDPALPVNQKYEIQLYDFYGRPKYW